MQLIERLSDENSLDSLLSLLKYRYPVLLLDSITYFEKDRYLVAVKNITRSDSVYGAKLNCFEYPESLIIESLVQASVILGCVDSMASVGISRHRVLSKIVNVEFGSSVRAGDQLVINVEVISKKPYRWLMLCKALTQENCVATAELSLVPESRAIY